MRRHASDIASLFSNFDEIVKGTHRVTQEWMTNLETHIEYLSFKIGDHTYLAQWIDNVLGEKYSTISRYDFDHVVFSTKKQCKEAVSLG